MRWWICFVVVILGCTAQPVCDEDTRLVSNRDYYGVASSVIESAEVELGVVMFVMRYYDDEVSLVNMLLDDLRSAVGRGVKVRVILEGSYEPSLDSLNRECALYLTAGGVEVRLDPDTITTHCKLLYSEGAVLVGSTNWTNSALESNNELCIYTTSPEVVGDAMGYFEDLWDSSVEVE